jgi:tetratricopeptide (TPR) repeat protein
MCCLGNSFYLAGQSREALATSFRRPPLAESVGDPSLVASTRWFLAQPYEVTGDYTRAIDTLELSLQLCAQHPGLSTFGGPPSSAEIVSRTWLAMSLAQQGEFARAASVAEPGMDLADRLGSPRWVVAACWGAGGLHLFRGELDAAASYLDHALDLCASLSLRIWFPVIAGFRGYAHVLRGRLAEGRDLLWRAGDAATTEERVHHARWLAWLGEAHVITGDVAEAANLASLALAMARARGERGNEAWALRLQGEIAAATIPPAVSTTETCYQEACAVAEELGMRPLVAHCHSGLSKFYRRAGKTAESDPDFQTARTMYRDMGMRFWLERAEAEYCAS